MVSFLPWSEFHSCVERRTTHEQACTSHPVSMDKSWNLPHFHKNLSCTAKPVITNIHCENTHTIKNNNKMHPAGPLLKFLDPPC